ncbi:uncharacterized protein [Palaemon carinicauda]|uniref:uncharacterized protein n=1 Tax=Palaemon carinicauda TaxID=392227 RepID=UPI0035B5ACE4
MRLSLTAFLLGLIVVPALVYGSIDIKEEENQGKFFLKSYQTTTITTLSIVVTTVPYFCAVTIAGIEGCQGRRLRRRRRLNLQKEDGDDNPIHLEKSMEEIPKEALGEEGVERLFFTLWQSTTTTVTITSTATNTSITISASAYCTFGGYNVPLC